MTEQSPGPSEIAEIKRIEPAHGKAHYQVTDEKGIAKWFGDEQIAKLGIKRIEPAYGNSHYEITDEKGAVTWLSDEQMSQRRFTIPPDFGKSQNEATHPAEAPETTTTTNQPETKEHVAQKVDSPEIHKPKKYVELDDIDRILEEYHQQWLDTQKQLNDLELQIKELVAQNKDKAEETEGSEPASGVWRNSKGIDQPVVVLGSAGIGPDGREYVKIEGSDTSIPADEFVANLPAQEVAEAASSGVEDEQVVVKGDGTAEINGFPARPEVLALPPGSSTTPERGEVGSDSAPTLIIKSRAEVKSEAQDNSSSWQKVKEAARGVYVPSVAWLVGARNPFEDDPNLNEDGRQKIRRRRRLGLVAGILAASGAIAYLAYRGFDTGSGGHHHEAASQVTTPTVEHKPTVPESLPTGKQPGSVGVPGGGPGLPPAAEHVPGNIAMDNWTWTVAHQAAPGRETEIMSKAMEQYGNGAHYLLVDGKTEIALGNGSIINPSQMEDLNRIIVGLAPQFAS